MKLFDTHAHVNDGRFDNDRNEMLQACFDTGVEYIMIPGVDRGTVESGLALAKQYDQLYAAVGTHPHESKDFTEEVEEAVDTSNIPPLKENITYDDFEKLDLRVAKVISCEKVPKSKKLLKFVLDIGIEERTVLSGICQ